MRTSTTNHYYLLDGLGSVAAVTDINGNVVASYSYEPFGKLKSQTGTLQNSYRWLGGLGVYFDSATGLYKMGTRYYDPALGRFTQVDPVDDGSANAYDYALQDPLNLTDPSGQAWIDFNCTRYEFTAERGFQTKKLRTGGCGRRGWTEKAVRGCGKNSPIGAIGALAEEFSRRQLKAKFRSPRKLFGLFLKSTKLTPVGAVVTCLSGAAAAER
jgi:RHS repeat-associated protein